MLEVGDKAGLPLFQIGLFEQAEDTRGVCAEEVMSLHVGSLQRGPIGIISLMFTKEALRRGRKAEMKAPSRKRTKGILVPSSAT